jgi:CRP/FNR family cyclic AMP-dependent transcriptional regulator
MAPEVDRRTLLAGLAMFEGLDEQEQDLLLGIARTRELARGELLFRKGEPAEQLYGVLEGRLRVSGERDGQDDVTFARLGPGEVIGEIALLDRSSRSATVSALEPTRLLSLHHDDLLPLLDAHPRVALKLAGVLAFRLRKLSALMEDTLLTLPCRLALNLLALAQVAGSSSDGVSFDIALPRTQLASLAGSAPETLEQSLREWEERGVVTVDHGVITVNGLEGLESLARFLIA